MPDPFYSNDQRFRQRFAFMDTEDNRWIFSDGEELGVKYPVGSVVDITQLQRGAGDVDSSGRNTPQPVRDSAVIHRGSLQQLFCRPVEASGFLHQLARKLLR